MAYVAVPSDLSLTFDHELVLKPLRRAGSDGGDFRRTPKRGWSPMARLGPCDRSRNAAGDTAQLSAQPGGRASGPRRPQRPRGGRPRRPRGRSRRPYWDTEPV